MADYYGGITGEGSCSSGKTCGPGAAIIAPFTYQQYDAGTRSWGSNDPECGYTASIPALVLIIMVFLYHLPLLVAQMLL